MKCPRCWTEKAYVRRVSGWKRMALACLLLVPLKCHHCYHRFTVLWFMTWGKQITPPILRIAPVSREAGPSYAAQHHAAQRARMLASGQPLDEDVSNRADAA